MTFSAGVLGGLVKAALVMVGVAALTLAGLWYRDYSNRRLW